MNTDAHETMVRAALGGLLNTGDLEIVVAANRHSDLFQLSPEKHFDNAPDREGIGRRWAKGLRHYFIQAVKYASPLKLNRKRALRAIGRATHAAQDFYAHTNWIEIHAASGRVETLAPLCDETLPIDQFPQALSSGFFSVFYGITGCPQCDGEFRPPRGYQYCHEQIAKDHQHRGHGADHALDGRTYYELAILLATRATLEVWNKFQEILDKKYGRNGRDK